MQDRVEEFEGGTSGGRSACMLPLVDGRISKVLSRSKDIGSGVPV